MNYITDRDWCSLGVRTYLVAVNLINTVQGRVRD